MAEHLSPTMSSSPDVYSEIGMSLTKNFRNQLLSNDDFESPNHQLNPEQPDDPLWAGGERLSTDNLASMFDLIQARLQTANTNDDDILDARPSYTSSPIINRVRSNESILSDITIDAALNSPIIPAPLVTTASTIIQTSTTRSVSTERYNVSNTNRVNTPTLKSAVVAAALEGVKIGGNNRFKSPPKTSSTNNFNDSGNGSNSPTKRILKTISKPSDVKELLSTLRSRSPSSSMKLNSSSSSSGAILNSPSHLTPTAYSVVGSTGRYKSPTAAASSLRSSVSNSTTPTRPTSAPRLTSGTKSSVNSRNSTPTLTNARGKASSIPLGSTPTTTRTTSATRSSSNNRPISSNINATAAVNPRSQTPTSRIRALLQSPSLLSSSSPPRRAKSPSVREIIKGGAGNRYTPIAPSTSKTQTRTPTTPSRSTTPSKPTVSTPNSTTKRSVSAPRPSETSTVFTNRPASTNNGSRSTTPTSVVRGGLGSTNSRPTTPSSTTGSTGFRRSTTPTSVVRGATSSTNSRPTTPNNNATVGRSLTPNSSSKLKLTSSTGSFNTPTRSTTPNTGIIKTRSTNAPAALSAPSPARSTTPNKGIIKTRTTNPSGANTTPSASRNTTPNRSGVSSTPSTANRTPSRSTTPTLRSSGTFPPNKSSGTTPTQTKRSTTPTGSVQNSRPSTPNSNRGTTNRGPNSALTGPTPASRLSALVSRSGPAAANRVQGSGLANTSRPLSGSKRTTSPSTVARLPTSSSSSSTNGSSGNTANNNKLKNVINSVQSIESHPWGGPSRKQESQKLSNTPTIPPSQPFSPPSHINLANEDDELANLALPSTVNSSRNEPKDHFVGLSNDEAMNEIFTTSRSASRNSGIFDEAIGASEPGNMNAEWVDNEFEKNSSGKIDGIARSPGSNDESGRGNKPPAPMNRTASPMAASVKPVSAATRRPSYGKVSAPEVALNSGSNKNRSSTPDRRNSAIEGTVGGNSVKKRLPSVIQPPSEEELAATLHLIKHVRTHFTPLSLTPDSHKFYMPSLTHSSQSAINAIYKIAKISAFATKSLIESNNQTQRMKSPDRQRPMGLGSANSLYGFNSSLSSSNSAGTTKSLLGLNSLSSNSIGNTTIATNTTDGRSQVSMTSPLTASWEELNRMTQMEWTSDSPITNNAEPVRNLKSHSSIARINSNSSMLADDEEDDNSTIESATFANIKARIMKRSNSMLQYEEEMERAAEDAVSVLTADSMSTHSTALNATNSTPFAAPIFIAPNTSSATRHASPSVTAIRSSTSLNQLNFPSPLAPSSQTGSMNTAASVAVTPSGQPTGNTGVGSRPSSGVYTISPTTPVISSGLISPAAPAGISANAVTASTSLPNSAGNKNPTNRSVVPTPPPPNSLNSNTNLRSPSMYGNNFGSPGSTQSPMLKSSSSSISSNGSPPSTTHHRPGPTAAYGVPVLPPSTTTPISSNQNSNSNSNGILSISSLNSTSGSPSKYRPYSTASNASTSAGTTSNVYSNNYNSNYNSYSSPSSNSQAVSSGSSVTSTSNNSVSGESPSRPRPGSGSFAYPPVVANSLMQSRGIPAVASSPGTSYLQQQQQRFASPGASSSVSSATSPGLNHTYGNTGGSSVGSSSGQTPNRYASPYNAGASNYGSVNSPSLTGYGYAPSGGSSSSSSGVGRYVSPGGAGTGVGLPPLHSKPPTSPYKSYTPAY